MANESCPECDGVVRFSHGTDGDGYGHGKCNKCSYGVLRCPNAKGHPGTPGVVGIHETFIKNEVSRLGENNETI